MSEFDLTKEQVLQSLADLEALGEVFKNPSWIFVTNIPDGNFEKVGITLRLVDGDDIQSRVIDSVYFTTYANVFMPQDYENAHIKDFLDRIKEYSHKIEFRYRGIIQFRKMME